MTYYECAEHSKYPERRKNNNMTIIMINLKNYDSEIGEVYNFDNTLYKNYKGIVETIGFFICNYK